jgi:hypothetical protein
MHRKQNKMNELLGFEKAIYGLKQGRKYARVGWNGKNMFIFMVAGSQFKVNREPLLSILGENTEISYSPHIDICFAPDKIAVWNPSQQDLFAEDWLQVE